ncbi:hypothetical protein BDF19DRAFT_432918 [Syncephalis fuscata]|nr:hypothetical protein BDF19DRAFT_432918 [Syncephalis fuscata]
MYRQSIDYVVAGLNETYPQHLLAPYHIEPAFWKRFIQAMNAALSEFPAWKNPQELTAGRQRRRFSFDATMSAASAARSVWWTDDTCGASGRDRAEKVLRWWNEDYFKQKGCWITLGFHRDDMPTTATNNTTTASDQNNNQSVCKTASTQFMDYDYMKQRQQMESKSTQQPVILSVSPSPVSNANYDKGCDNINGNSTLKPFLTIHPI